VWVGSSILLIVLHVDLWGVGFEVHVVSTAFDNRGRRVARVGLSVEGSLCKGLGLGLGWGLRL